MKKIFILTVLVILITCSFNFITFAEDTEEQPLVSTVFFETDIREALNELAMQTGVNIIYDDTVYGTVTLDLVDVPLEQALDMILISGGYTYQKIDDYYLVGFPDADSPTFQHLTETKTIELNYISASLAQELLPNYYTQFTRISGERDNLLTITAPKGIIESYKTDLKKIDNPEKQILIEVLVTEVSTEVLKESGSELLQLFTGEGNTDLDYYDYLAENDEDFFVGLIDDALTLAAESSHSKLLTVLKALEEEEQAEITANPRIRVTDRETAELFVGEERTIILEPGEEDPTLETVDVGIALEVTPEILSKDELRLQFTPDISHFTHESRDQLKVKKSELDTSVYAKEGETLNLASMTLDEDVRHGTQIPLLGDIPLLRWFFSGRTERKGERELMIFITPRIVEGGEDAVGK